MPAHSDTTSAVERHLLLQLGGRLKHARERKGLSASALARMVGISRTTLQAVEGGEPSPTMGTYLRVLAALGMAADLALVATGESENAPDVSLESGRHAPQDLQSLLLHKEAVQLVRLDPALVARARETLQRWRERGDPHTMPLWDEWVRILERGQWSKVLGNTQRGRQLRQASPLSTLLPPETRQRILSEVKALRREDTARTKERQSHAAARA